MLSVNTKFLKPSVLPPANGGKEESQVTSARTYPATQRAKDESEGILDGSRLSFPLLPVHPVQYSISRPVSVYVPLRLEAMID